MRVAPALASAPTYPFVELELTRRALVERGVAVCSLGAGEPQERTPAFIANAIAEEALQQSEYPSARGLAELRAAAAEWCARRFGVVVDPEREVVPTYGAKEAIFSLAQILVDPTSEKRTVVVGEPAYPVYERGAAFAGAHVKTVALRAENGYLLDLDEIEPDTALVWINYPHNPTGATAPRHYFEDLAELAERLDFYIASDEAYSEIWFDEPTASALQACRNRTVVFQTLSKRSSMTGFRSGFLVAPPELTATISAYRASAGTAPQEFLQRASVLAWQDEQHVEENRNRYRAKRELLVPAFETLGWEVTRSDATFFLWVATPSGGFESLRDAGVLVAPGHFFGRSGSGFVRVALVAPLEDCARAAGVIASL